jgi:FAD/FMN-containing dehydrogenase
MGTTAADGPDRRALLRLAAAGAGAVLVAGCGRGPTAAPRSTSANRASGGPAGGTAASGATATGTAAGGAPTAATSSGPAASASAGPLGTPAEPDWTTLRSLLSGRLVLPQDRAYAAARLSANPRFDDLRPAAVAQCATASDVAAALRFARDGGVPFTVRSGGHCYGGWSTGTGLVIDVSAMNSVTPTTLSPGSAGGAGLAVGAGTRLIDLYTQAARHGVGVPGGSCPSVGATGLTLGGGVGVLTRLWGLTCDALAGAQLVTADGRVRTVSASADPDLLWASRGGGGGSFGIVTQLTYRARPVATDPSIAQLSTVYFSWPWGHAAQVVTAWQAWAPTADRRLWTTCKVLARDGRPRVFVAGVWAGPGSGLTGALGKALSGLLSAVGSAPTTRSVVRRGYLATMLTEAGCTSSASCHLPPAGTLAREPLAATSHVPPAALSPSGVTTLVSLVDDLAANRDLRSAGLVEAGASLDALGGAVTDIDSAATAFGHRSAPFTIQYTATAAPNAPSWDPFLAAVRAMRTRLVYAAGTGAYVNYCDSDVQNFADAYWADNRWRLQRIKHTYDPDGVFTFPQAVQG